MNYKFQRYCVWAGILFLVLFGISLMPLANFIPPPAPAATGQDLLAHYEAHRFGVRFAMWIGMLAAAMLVPYSAVIASQMARIEPGRFPVLSMTAFGSGAVNAVFFIMPYMLWSAAIYRLDRSPELVRMVSDAAWLEFVMVYAPFALQLLTFGIVGLSDKRAKPIFPRWFCFMCFWVTLLIVPGGFAVMFETGPFAWNGLLAFWVPVGAFSIFLPAQIVLLFKAIKQQELEEGDVMS